MQACDSKINLLILREVKDISCFTNKIQIIFFKKGRFIWQKIECAGSIQY